MTADEIREKTRKLFQEGRPVIAQFAQYSSSMAALVEEYHRARIADFGVTIEEKTLVATWDARQSPESLDTAIRNLEGVVIKAVIYDPVNLKYYIYA